MKSNTMQINAIERKAKEEQMDFKQRRKLREQEALPILKDLKQWSLEQYPNVLPKSLIGKALFMLF